MHVDGSGLSDTPLPSQTVTATGTVWNYANPAPIVSPGYVGRVFTGTPVASVVRVANTAPVSWSEGLDSVFTPLPGDVSVSGGPVLNLPAGSNDTSVTVRLNTSSAGSKSGLVVVDQALNGANSGLDNTNLGSQVVSMSGDVFDHGVASFDHIATINALHLTLSGNQGDSVSQPYDIFNLMQTEGFTGALDLTGWDITGGTGVNPGLATGTIAAGQHNTFTATLDTSVAQVFAPETVTIHFTDSASDGIAGDTVPQTLIMTIDATVVPEPSTIILLAVALLGIAAYVRRRK